LLDAVYLAANHLRGASNRRKALVVISDGEDNHSRYSEKDVQQVLREADAQLYAIGGFGWIGYGILEKMVDMTGGRMFGGYAIEDTTSKIWAELRNQYVLVYKPQNRIRDGKWRKIEVRLRSLPRGMPKLYVNAKSGYLAPE
jgi:Ca-activated chloride channel family protein